MVRLNKEGAMEQIRLFLETVKLARKQVYQNMTVFPLLKPDGIIPDYLTVEQALAAKSIQIREVSDQGNVPELMLVNFDGVCVLIVEGEELVGAKQNRIVNSTFLIPGKTETVLPVSCVEQGRWRYQSDEFHAGGRVMYSSLRRAHQQEVRSSLREQGRFRSDQGEVWRSIDQMSARMKVASPTGAMADVFERMEDRLSGFIKSFTLVEWQVGAVFAINGRIMGVECFWCHDTFRRFFGRLLKSYALDALDSANEDSQKPVQPAMVKRFLSAVADSEAEAHPSIGLGFNLRFESRAVTGAALVEGNRMLHMSAFKKEKGKGTRSTGFLRFPTRRERHLY